MLFRAMRVIKRSAERVGRSLLIASGPLGRLFLNILVLPIYRFSVLAKLRIQRLALPARSLVLFFITNRFLLHATLGITGLLTVLLNVQSRQVHAQDVGQHSMLFALATDQRTEVVEEVVRPETQAKNANYLGASTIVSVPHIDFDYDDSSADVSPSIIVPGTIAAQPLEQGTDTTQAPRTTTETYVVQENDTISTIAHQFRVNVGTILWNNHLNERQYIRPGDSLRIPPVSGMLATVKKGDTLSKIAQRYQADADEIASFNHLGADQQVSIGTELVIPGGSPPAIVETRTQIAAYTREPQPVTRPRPSVSTPVAETSSSEEPSEGLSEPSTPITKPADVDTSAAPKTRLLWPTSGHVITQYYGWKHTGVDIDGDYSSPLYASADGVVEKAGWNSGGYGLMILIDHPDGLKTRYGHSSKLFVKAGDTVKKGQVIAMMGTTGRSTGTHLHYEVYVNNKRTNPLTYIR